MRQQESITLQKAADAAEPPSGAQTFNMKYIRHKKLGFVLFEATVGHDDVANSLGGPEEVLSAGFVFAQPVELRCIGSSFSLNICASPSDGRDLRTRINTL